MTGRLAPLVGGWVWAFGVSVCSGRDLSGLGLGLDRDGLFVCRVAGRGWVAFRLAGRGSTRAVSRSGRLACRLLCVETRLGVDRLGVDLRLAALRARTDAAGCLLRGGRSMAACRPEVACRSAERVDLLVCRSAVAPTHGGPRSMVACRLCSVCRRK